MANYFHVNLLVITNDFITVIFIGENIYMKDVFVKRLLCRLNLNIFLSQFED